MSAKWIIIGVILLALAIRLPGLGKIMTADERIWMLRSAYFYDALLEGNPGGTFLGTHPGSGLMALVGLGETIQEQRLGIGVDDSTLQHFRKVSVIPIAVVTALLVGLITALLLRLGGATVAAVGGILLAVEPYVVGMSMIVHLDALQSLLMLSSLLSFLFATRRLPFERSYAVLSGVLFGLALGFKLLLALWLLPIFFLVVSVRWRLWHNWQNIVRVLGFVCGVTILSFWLSWPALWVKEDLGRSLARDYRSVLTDEHVVFEAVEDPIAPPSFYIRTFLGRLTPTSQLLGVGAFIAAASLVVRKWRKREVQTLGMEAEVVLWLFFYSIGFLFFITLAAKKADRYALPALTAWPVMAGWLVWYGGRILQRSKLLWRVGRILLLVLLLVITVITVRWAPWAIAYNNPIFPAVRPLSQQGWGEGLEAAAEWLNARPGAKDMYIASWYPAVMQTHFVGKTMSHSSRGDYRVQYLVTYRNMGGRAGDDQASDVLDEVQGRTPVHTVYIHGVPYVWIYDTLSVGNFLRTVGEVKDKVQVGQTVMPGEGEWSSVDIGFATFSSRANTEDVLLHIRASTDSSTDIRTVTVNARDIVDNEWHRFSFDPIVSHAGQVFYVMVESPASTTGNAVTVRYTDADVREGQMYLNGRAKSGDIAYRLPEEELGEEPVQAE